MPHPCLHTILDEHAAIRAVLSSLTLMVEQGPCDEPQRFFDVVRAMLFYIDEFPEKLHHPKESNLLFPKLAKAAPHLMPVITRLETDHLQGEGRVRDLQHHLLAWELMGESRRGQFETAANDYVRFYLHHMRVEEAELMPAAPAVLGDDDWRVLDAAFAPSANPMACGYAGKEYDRLFSRIALFTPAPIGLGKSFHRSDQPA